MRDANCAMMVNGMEFVSSSRSDSMIKVEIAPVSGIPQQQ